MSSTGKRRALAVTGQVDARAPVGADPEAPEGDEVRGVAQHPDLVEAAAADARQAADRQLHGGARAAGRRRARRAGRRPRARARPRARRRRRRRRRSAARRPPRRGRRAPWPRRPRSRGGAIERRAPAPAATLARGHGDAQRRRRGGSHSSRPERPQRAATSRSSAGMSSRSRHAPSASIISRRRVSPRTMRALTVPMRDAGGGADLALAELVVEAQAQQRALVLGQAGRAGARRASARAARRRRPAPCGGRAAAGRAARARAGAGDRSRGCARWSAPM